MNFVLPVFLFVLGACSSYWAATHGSWTGVAVGVLLCVIAVFEFLLEFADLLDDEPQEQVNGQVVN